MSGSLADHASRLAAALLARRDFANAVRLLNAAGIVPMPLKGVLLQHLVYQNPGDRPLTDADLLIPPTRFDAGVRVLLHAGYGLRARGRVGVVLGVPDGSVALDLHRRPFGPGLFALTAEQLFARGRIDERTFGTKVVLPSPRDLYAHLVGNFAKGRHGQASKAQIHDLSAVASRFGLASQPTARHLEAHGLARAARYTLPLAVKQGDRFASRVLGALRPDPVGVLAADAARTLVERYGSGRGSLLGPHLVNRSLLRGAFSATAHAGLGAQGRLRRLQRATSGFLPTWLDPS